MNQVIRDPLSSGVQFNPDDLRVTRLRAVRGPNFWRLAPVIACDLTLGSLEDVPSTGIPGFNERLMSMLPTLIDHPCSRGTEGGFVERLTQGTHLPHIMEHVALELQTLAGTDVSFGRVVESGDPGVWWLIVAYEEEDVGLQSVRDAVKVVRACMTGEELDVGRMVQELHELLEDVRLGPSTAAIVEEARRRGIPVRRLNNSSLVQLGLGKNLRRVQAAMSDYTSAIGVEIAQDKDDTRREKALDSGQARRTACSSARRPEMPRPWLASSGLRSTGKPISRATSSAPSRVEAVSPSGAGRPMLRSTRRVSSLSCAISTPMALV